MNNRYRMHSSDDMLRRREAGLGA
jgi:hypothetical protein